jgi:uncharacterized membrane protein YfcA
MLARRRDPIAADTPGGADPPGFAATYPEGDRDIPYGVARLPLGMALVYGAGLISALLGIGSGVLEIPAMDSALRLPLKVSSATSSLMIGVTAAASAGATSCAATSTRASPPRSRSARSSASSSVRAC